MPPKALNQASTRSPPTSANLACTIAAWKQPIDYMPQPEPEPPRELQRRRAPPPAEPVTMAGPGAWAEMKRIMMGDGSRVVILPRKSKRAPRYRRLLLAKKRVCRLRGG